MGDIRHDLLQLLVKYFSGDMPSRGWLAWFGAEYVTTTHGGARKAGSGHWAGQTTGTVAGIVGVSERLVRGALKVRRAAEAYDERHGINACDNPGESAEWRFEQAVDYHGVSDSEWVVRNVPEDHWVGLLTVMDDQKGVRTLKELWENYDVPDMWRQMEAGKVWDLTDKTVNFRGM
jgi:hypothetical protein